ncbi:MULTISPECIES: amino acid ABC transporter permease [unclassified Desulfovibrio]|uniref:amino acid ABC transporter permease n=1 Tax=unclassified Desulfovibrio TaxID=2593640 RepID=UPI0019820D20|nr:MULTISPECIES: amino acid ABC transporter permease [unclassified Desulfovibrio]
MPHNSSPPGHNAPEAPDAPGAPNPGGPHRRARFGWRGPVLLLALAALAWVYLELASEGMSYEWQWNRVWRHFGRWTAHGFVAGPLCEGLVMTLGIAAAGFCLSTLLGLAAAVCRLSPWHFCRLAAGAYIELLRNTPLLLQLFFVYFLLSPLFSLGPFGSAVLALGAFEGAYMAELFRAGLLSVPRGQWEAALSLGFGLSEALRLVILPQAARNMLPPLTSQIVTLIKDTSLVSAIAVADLTMRAQAIIAETFLAFEVWLLVAAIYLALTLLASVPAWLLERRNGSRPEAAADS